ncbi:MAG: methylthioadenosine phosphorylase [Bdellovibrionales bacterium RIFOXYB1_FULL_37_110]|nr:MAG: methylthioadenosine phosphorylase [Bdellovibrionales bacterium RIFOXYA1_FULL_38_20]OFZ47372.1 MAG: methylthioadenosine phosphorylase [Bdellovibrionales bacterium RIFOXYC1_FULL_37_79]OFZ60551.1 MAG: methylthioadenosine phosphorylase [Bdellovibrionales bacterium RIFOXYB1_FULL_37_110]OFZ64918.1 MAG: methylthioadenosine phosphorylase [Bdellovibrionales bacterium RIFOXYD1_FULL_36_51]OFZ66423.1 MAG: methylthioadenosine phosphorylase [Bdellovibrionales bacterium RIFOXYB2_FULL_36_6]
MNSKREIGIIGGSGVYKIEGIEIVKEHEITTPFGAPSSAVIEAKINGEKFYFIPRHGKFHTFLPSEVNYRANIFALKTLGVKYVISASAVGSLKDELPPTTFVLPSQFIDWTKGLRKRSFFGEGMVGHVSTAVPVNLTLQNLIAKTCKEVGVKYSKGGSYLCIEGPQFSSKAESAIYRELDASVIGMTNVPESYLAKEAGMAYATIAMVTDYDCWKEQHCTVEEVMNTMKTNNEYVKKVLLKLIPALGQNKFDFNPENQNAVMTDPEKLASNHKKILEVLLG